MLLSLLLFNNNNNTSGVMMYSPMCLPLQHRWKRDAWTPPVLPRAGPQGALNPHRSFPPQLSSDVQHAGARGALPIH